LSQTQSLEQIVQQALAKQKTDAPPKFLLEEYLFDKQLAFVRDPSSFKIAVTTRRAGKSTSCGADLMDTCSTIAGVNCLYITLSRKNAKRLIWPELKRINRRFKLGGEVNESDLTITFPNESVLYISGASDRTEIENFRGMALKKVYIDEGQSFPAYIRELIDDVIGPALMDHAGVLALIGTPGPIPSGYFYDISQSNAWSKHFWSFFDNPHISAKSGLTHQQILDRELKRRGVDATDPSIQREWFGKWVLDTDSLVYKFNYSTSVFEGAVPQAQWSYILGVDLGFDDADALAVLAWSPTSPTTYLVDEQVTRHQGITELVDQIDTLKKKYDITKIVVDTAGLGKKISEEIQSRYKIATQPAEKVRKLEYIELMNDALRTGRLKARRDSRFAQDCMRVEWDADKSRPDKKIISNRFHSDICEAVLYAWRESYAYTHTPERAKPKHGSKQWADEEAARLEEAALEHFTSLEEAAKGYGWE